MNPYMAEFVGTAILVLLGNGVVANVVLQKTKGSEGGWLMICTGWGLAVFAAVACVEEYSGAHLNPAVTIGLAAAGKFAGSKAFGYIVAQLAGAFFGACLVYFFYLPYFDATKDPDAKLAAFCTAPNIRSGWNAFFSEVIATSVLVFAVLVMTGPTFKLANAEVEVGLGSIGAVRVGLIVFVIGLCLGGTSGYAINPARDFSPRLAHAILPVSNKRDSDWGYAPIPIFGPILGAILAAMVYGITT